MLKSIRSLLSHIGQESQQQDPQKAIQIAVAVLFIEMSRIDGHIDHKELIGIQQLLENNFDLSDAEKHELIELAEQDLNQSTDYYQFTAEINRAFNHDEKVQMIQNLWKIAFSDGEINPHEDHYLRKICSLLHVSHKDFIKTKHRAKTTD